MNSYLLLACLLVGSGVAETIKWIGMFNWAAVTPLHVNLTFGCVLNDNGTDKLPENHFVIPSSERWQLKGDDQLRGGPSLELENKYQINGENLTILNVTMQDKGIYLCHVELNCSHLVYPDGNCSEKERWFKHGLNLNGPLYDNLIDKYQQNFIVGSIAAGSVLGLFALLCLVYKFRHKEPKEEGEDTTGTPGISLTQYNGPDLASSQM